MKTIAVMLSIDTKEAEARFLKEYIEARGHKALLIDISTRGVYDLVPDVTRDEIAATVGVQPDVLLDMGKSEAVQTMMDGAKTIVPALYEAGRFDGIISAGGLQNTMAAVGAMQTLPIGVPKVMVSTVACGTREFEPFVGIKDVVMIPSIADITGINSVMETILGNAAAAVIGMTEQAKLLPKDGKTRIGITLMGVTNSSATQAARLLEEQGYEVVSFHSTGVGGRYMEYLIQQGLITAVVDISLHEVIAADVFHLGFSNGAPGRLKIGCEAGIPMVVAPGALDFVDVYVKDFKNGIIGDWTKRKYNLHNNAVAHVKAFADEAAQAAKLVVERLNQAKGPVTVLLPLRGMRLDTQPGQRLYDPEVDEAILNVFRSGLDQRIRLIEVDANLTDMTFSKVAADEMLALIGGRTARE